MTVWHDDKRRVFLFRLKRLYPGDALIDNASNWRVWCIDDALDKANLRIYIVERDGVEIFRRKKIESVATFLTENNAPATLQVVQGGASHKLRVSALTEADFLGFLPIHNYNPRVNSDLISTLDGYLKRLTTRFSNFETTMRLVVQKKQSNWTVL